MMVNMLLLLLGMVNTIILQFNRGRNGRILLGLLCLLLVLCIMTKTIATLIMVSVRTTMFFFILMGDGSKILFIRISSQTWRQYNMI